MITAIENALGETITENRPVSRARTGTVSVLKTVSGRKFILKTAADPRRLSCEAHGLQELQKADAIAVPNVLINTAAFLVTTYIASAPADNAFWEQFGREFAALHRYTASGFGFYEDNFIGATIQKNIAETTAQASSWHTFFMEKHLLFQYRLAEKNGYAGDEFRQAFSRLEKAVPGILEGSEEPPALLHGDLWSGNFIPGSDGHARLIDPAVYYGHREADLAMTELFGGFPNIFYAAYREAYPLPDGYERRAALYKLYHILNHLNIFGSGYYRQALEWMRAPFSR